MKIQLPDISQQFNLDGIRRFTAICFQKLSSAMNGNLSFSDNIDCQIISGIGFTSGLQLQIPHTLGRVPTGFMPISLSASMTLYNGTSAWTSGNIYLISSASGTAGIIVF